MAPEEQSNEYRVEKIMDKCIRNNVSYYLIKWADYPEEQNTWEPLSNLFCMQLVDEYERGHEQLLDGNYASTSAISESYYDTVYTPSPRQINAENIGGDDDDDDNNGNHESTSTSDNTTGSEKNYATADDDDTTDDTDDTITNDDNVPMHTDNKVAMNNVNDENYMATNLRNLHISTTFASGFGGTSIVSPINFLESYDTNMRMISPIASMCGDNIDKDNHQDGERNYESIGTLNSSVVSSSDNPYNITNLTNREAAPEKPIITESIPVDSMNLEEIGFDTPTYVESEQLKVRNELTWVATKTTFNNSPCPLLTQPLLQHKDINKDKECTTIKPPTLPVRVSITRSLEKIKGSEEDSFLVNNTTTMNTSNETQINVLPVTSSIDLPMSFTTASEEVNNETDIMLPLVSSSIYSPIRSPVSSLESNDTNDEMMNASIQNAEMSSTSIKDITKKKGILQSISSSPIYSPTRSLTGLLDWEISNEDIHYEKEKLNTSEYGYGRGLKLRKIKKLFKFDKCLFYVVYWYGLADPDLVSKEEISKKNPLETMQFLEEYAHKLTNSGGIMKPIVKHNMENIPDYKIATNKQKSNDQQESTQKQSEKEKMHNSGKRTRCNR